MFVDVHTHVFHPRIVEKAKQHLYDHYKLPCRCKGTPEDLLMRAHRCGIDHVVALCAATSASQVIPCNGYAGFLQNTYPEITAFGSIHPDFPDWKGQLDRLRIFGVRGIKLHPDFQEFAIDDPAAFPIYELAQQNGVPILFHTGDNRFAYSNPHRLAKIMQVFPHLTVIGAHFGGWSEWDEAVEVLAKTENLFFDTSSTRAFIPIETIRKSVHTFGADRLLFGTDFPMWDAEDELPFIDRLGLHESEKEKVLCANACNLLGIEL